MSSTSVVIRDFLNQIPGSLSRDKLRWEFPIIKSRNAHGRETFWRALVAVVDGDGAPIKIRDEFFDSSFDFDMVAPGLRGEIRIEAGVVGGKIRAVKPTYILTGKNLGKKSQTNIWTQALRHALTLHNQQKKKTVPTVGADADTTTAEAGEVKECFQDVKKLYPPMLAQSAADLPAALSKLAAPIAYQPKYNGLRVVIVGACAYSRGLRPYPGLAHIKRDLRPLAAAVEAVVGEPCYFDGEIYAHGVPLQDINSAARREDADDSALRFMIFDIFSESLKDKPFAERWRVLQRAAGSLDKTPHIELVPTHFVATADGATNDVDTIDIESAVRKINMYYKRLLREGYEGVMIRANAPYRFSYNNYHSPNLLKLKPVLDHEFKIVGWKLGKMGKAANALMLICDSPGGEFAVTPAIPIEEREALGAKMAEVEANGKTHFENHWLGKKIIVYFSEYSKAKIPLQPRTKMEIREWD